ncbi:CU044_2847 family protein [Streptomyces sp. NPDC014734]|uniref:CU044_2847 family protein n=1 Tax=Streptomyces sp. NPDC014734 TaxID=3364886 RepID=UPI00370183C9
MDDNGARVTRIEMPDGTPVWARISGAEELAAPSLGPAFTDIGYGDFADQVQARVESLRGVVTSVARSLAEPLRAVRPDEVSVEFGIELTAKAGKVVGLLADGEAKGGITVTLTWHGGGPPVDPAIPSQGGAGTAGRTPSVPDAEPSPPSSTYAAPPRPAPPMPPGPPPAPPNGRDDVPPASPGGRDDASAAAPGGPDEGSAGGSGTGASTGAPMHRDGDGRGAGSRS